MMPGPTDPTPAGERNTSVHLRRAADNDQQSVAWLVSRFTPLLLCQARHRMPPSLRRHYDPEDAVADVWMVVLSALPSLHPSQGSFSLGLVRFASTVMLRRIRDLLEKHVLGKPIAPSGPATDLAADTRGVVTHVVAEETRSLVWQSLERLPPLDRQILVLHGIEGQAHKDVALRVGVSPDTCKVRYHRAMKRLRDLVPDSVFDDLED